MWMNSLSPAPTTANEWLETIRKEHSIEDKESSARTALQVLRLTTPYTAGTFNLNTAAFDALLPRVPLIDYISPRDVFYGTLPKPFRDKLLDQAQARQIEGCTYQNLKDIGRELWKNGYRPTAAALSAGPSKPSASSSRFQSYLIQAKKVNTQNWSAEEKKQYYSTFKCFHCHQVGHMSQEKREDQSDGRADLR